ncbi:excalibur calcium-binding domain-containing protein [Nocardia cyriacigeorgica]|uniref:excalibur calcium-binding domain-containing protein n=1 Tax=Nocardia cyriacigeorgica TaxID=135487 RepID=UPI0024585136|nr:excalibur calcium-binding domain-containing protein [Nocardia cyriacigeorgica]
MKIVPLPRRALPGAAAATPKASPFYLTCGEARRDGEAPIRQGQRGYSLRLDPDRNGVACEPGEP